MHTAPTLPTSAVLTNAFLNTSSSSHLNQER